MSACYCSLGRQRAGRKLIGVTADGVAIYLAMVKIQTGTALLREI
jgi:hypothetical protein